MWRLAWQCRRHHRCLHDHLVGSGALWELGAHASLSQGPRRDFSTSQAQHAASNQPGLFDALAMVFSPAQLGASTLELAHQGTGLPWWASIPATAVAARAALLPLSLKAKQASAHVQLLNTAFSQAKVLTLNLGPQETQDLKRTRLVRTMYRLLCDREKLPSMRWYWANAAAQCAVFFTMTSGLGAMSAAVWPGFATGGPPGLRDLSSPPVFLGTFSTPFGTMGAVTPLAIILSYVRVVDSSATASVPGMGVALRVLAVPLYCLSLIQPHATLLYALAHTLTCVAVQSIPATAATASNDATQADVKLLLALGKHYASLSPTQHTQRAAQVCLQRVVVELQQRVAQAQQQAQGSAERNVHMTPRQAAKAAAASVLDDQDEVVPAGVSEQLAEEVEMLAEAQRQLSLLEDSAADRGVDTAASKVQTV